MARGYAARAGRRVVRAQPARDRRKRYPVKLTPLALWRLAGHHGFAGTPAHGFGIVRSFPMGSGCMTTLVRRG
jgi:hypothetical protein